MSLTSLAVVQTSKANYGITEGTIQSQTHEHGRVKV